MTIPYPSIDWTSDDRLSVVRAHIEALFAQEQALADCREHGIERLIERERQLADLIVRVYHAVCQKPHVLEHDRTAILTHLEAVGVKIEPLPDGKLDGARWRRMLDREVKTTEPRDFTDDFFTSAQAEGFTRVVPEEAGICSTTLLWLNIHAPALSDGEFDRVKIAALSDAFVLAVTLALESARLKRIVSLSLSVPTLEHPDYPGQLFRSRFYQLTVTLPAR